MDSPIDPLCLALATPTPIDSGAAAVIGENLDMGCAGGCIRPTVVWRVTYQMELHR